MIKNDKENFFVIIILSCLYHSIKIWIKHRAVSYIGLIKTVDFKLAEAKFCTSDFAQSLLLRHLQKLSSLNTKILLFCALSIVTERSRALKTGWNGVQCKNDSVTPAQYGGACFTRRRKAQSLAKFQIVAGVTNRTWTFYKALLTFCMNWILHKLFNH